jgi:hypothetical protein
MRPRIFGLGLSKTGTHSLNSALTALGFPSIHYPDPGLMLAGRFDDALRGFAAGTDISVAAFYRELDVYYPGSKFILTLRGDLEGWLESVGDHRRRRDGAAEDPGCPKAAVRRLVYGTSTFDRELFIMAYHRHASAVRAYFEGRPGTLLELDIIAGDGWDELCPFLRVETPEAPFPDLNKRKPAAA